MLRTLFLTTLSLTLTATSNATTPPETHTFHVQGKVKYRCYAGYGGKKAVDEMTKQPCDNKDYESTVIDKNVSIEIKDEPDPETSDELAGSWSEKFKFKGRTFEIAMTLFKDPTAPLYRLRLAADDNEPTSRTTAVFTKVKSLNEMDPLSIDYGSAGKKEEIRFQVEVKPALKK